MASQATVQGRIAAGVLADRQQRKAEREAWEARAAREDRARQRRLSAGDRRLEAFLAGERRPLTWAGYLARTGGVTIEDVLRETRAAGIMALDFGRRKDGERLVYFYSSDVTAWLREAGKAGA